MIDVVCVLSFEKEPTCGLCAYKICRQGCGMLFMFPSMLFWDVLGPGVETDGKNLPLSLVRGLIWSTTTCSAYLKHGFCIWFCMYVVFLVFTILPLYTYKANEIVGFWWQFRLADTSYIVHMLPKKIHPNAMCSELCECGNVTARDGATSC